MNEYITRWDLIQLLNKRIPLSPAQRIALDEYLEPQTIARLGRVRALLVLIKQEVAEIKAIRDIEERLTWEAA